MSRINVFDKTEIGDPQMMTIARRVAWVLKRKENGGFGNSTYGREYEQK